VSNALPALPALPYAAEFKESVRTAFERGPQPKGIAALVAWFREQCANEIPMTLHKPGVWRDYGDHAQGGSQLGSLPLGDAFRRLLENSPSELDEDGFYVRPLRAALSRYSRQAPLTAMALYGLALVDGDWRRWATKRGYNYEIAERYLAKALEELWREFARERLRTA
jgi:hypothetical protein